MTKRDRLLYLAVIWAALIFVPLGVFLLILGVLTSGDPASVFDKTCNCWIDKGETGQNNWFDVSWVFLVFGAIAGVAGSIWHYDKTVATPPPLWEPKPKPEGNQIPIGTSEYTEFMEWKAGIPKQIVTGDLEEEESDG